MRLNTQLGLTVWVTCVDANWLLNLPVMFLEVRWAKPGPALRLLTVFYYFFKPRKMTYLNRKSQIFNPKLRETWIPWPIVAGASAVLTRIKENLDGLKSW